MDDPSLRRSLEQLEADPWPPPSSFDSRLVQEVHRLRSVPIGALSTEDLRLLLSQRVGTRWLVPLALDQLTANPLAAGDFYPGDLLTAVLRSEPSYWDNHPDQLLALFRVKEELESLRDTSERLLALDDWPAFG